MPAPSAPPLAWTPILEGDLAARALEAVLAVAEAIGEAPLVGFAGPTLASGEAGLALFFDSLERAGLGESFGDIALVRMERAIEGLAANPLEAGLYSGFTGVAWVAERLQGGEPGEPHEDDDLNAGIDAGLLRHLTVRPWPFHFDLISGLAGYGVYALRRLPRPAAVAALERIVEHLAELAQPRPGGVGWHTPYEMQPEPNKKWFPKGLDNLGMAHGTPGVIAFLARVVAAGVARERAEPLLRASMSWLLAQRLPAGGRSVFPFMVGEEVKLRPARAAWCFGDPGIAAAVLAAGRALREPAWEAEALSLARAVAARPAESCGINDACLCHGTAGLGHLLNRLHQATGDPSLREAARGWFRRTLDFWQPGTGIGGFRAFTPVDETFENLDWNDDPGFLNGAAGMALALLAALRPGEPTWDGVLLLAPTPDWQPRP